MAKFNLRIAGHTAQVHTLFESTLEYCRPYLTCEMPEFSITVTREDLQFEQEQRITEARQEGFRIRIAADPLLERAAIQRKFAEFLLDYDTLLFHGSAIAVDGMGYLFTARSGTGKSTHTRLWRETFGDRAIMVNDDKPFLQITEKGVWICGSPWSGKHGLDTNVAVPLKGICLLRRGSENRIRAAQPEEVIDMLRHACFHPLDDARLPRVHTLVDALAEQTKLWCMECNKDPQAALVAYEAMSEQPQRQEIL